MRASIIIATALFAVPAFAQDLPRFDVEKYCDEIASLGGSSSEMMKGACFDQEQTAYDKSKSRWTELPSSIRSYCLDISRFGGASYMMLDACIDQEIKAKQGNDGRAFKY